MKEEAIYLEDLLLTSIDVSKADIDDGLGVEARREPRVKDGVGGSGQTEAVEYRREQQSCMGLKSAK